MIERRKLVLNLLASLAFINTHAQSASPRLLVYKARDAYAQLVPVTLSADKKSIVSYPDPHDVKAGIPKLQPVKLHKGYYLDNMGINENTTFLKISYKAYAALTQAPSVVQLQRMLAPINAITTICDCGARSRFKDHRKELDRLIDNGTLFKACKLIKQTKR